MESFAPTERTTLKRLPQRGFYDREVVYRILDGFVCHVGFTVDGQPFVTDGLRARRRQTFTFTDRRRAGHCAA